MFNLVSWRSNELNNDRLVVVVVGVVVKASRVGGDDIEVGRKEVKMREKRREEKVDDKII